LPNVTQFLKSRKVHEIIKNPKLTLLLTDSDTSDDEINAETGGLADLTRYK